MDEIIPSACPHDCPDACSFLVRKAEGSKNRITIESGKVIPFQEGWICLKGKRWERRYRTQNRLKRPLKKNGNGWVEISWDDAWTIWANHLMEATEKYGPQANLFYQSAGSQYFSKRLGREIFSALGGYSEPAGSLCGAAGGAGLKKAFGHIPVYAPEKLYQVKGILLWGRNVFDTHPHLVPLLTGLKNRSKAFAAIEIRTTRTTEAAERWWRIKPGTDAILALLLCKNIVESGDAASGWMEHSEKGEQFIKLLAELDSKALLDETGLSQSDLSDLCRWILEHRPLAIYGGYGIQRYYNGSFTFHTLASLALLLGSFKIPGTGVVFGKDEMRFFPEDILKPTALKRKVPVADWHLRASTLSSPIKTALFTCSNPAKQGPETDRFPRAMESMDFSVCIDLEMTETAALCDLVLPAACFLEEGPDWRGSWWHTYLLRSEKALDPPGQALPEPVIMTGLADKLGLGIDLENMRTKMDRILLESPETEALGEGVFRTKESHGWTKDAGPIKLPEVLHPERSRNDWRGLRFITVHTAEYINGQNWGVNEDLLNAVFVSPLEGNRRGLREGDRVRVRKKDVVIHAVLRFDKAMDSGYCVMVQGSKGTNMLTTAGTSPGYGTPFHESFVVLEAEPESDENA